MKPARKVFSPALLSRMIAGRERFLTDGLPGTAHSLSNFPEFGHARRADFRLAEGIDHLNHGGYGATPVLNGGLWVRVSAQIYNEIGDYTRLAAIGRRLAC